MLQVVNVDIDPGFNHPSKVLFDVCNFFISTLRPKRN
jgi:hypothetical protein